MKEAWRTLNGDQREYSWISNRHHGFRIDHAFPSPALLPRLIGAKYSHTERQQKISDHSLLIVELANQNQTNNDPDALKQWNDTV
jgi:exodeoxyribonuclease III